MYWWKKRSKEKNRSVGEGFLSFRKSGLAVEDAKAIRFLL